MKIKQLIIALLGSALTACSTTANLPEGEMLYTGIKDLTYGDGPKAKKKKASEEGVITSLAEAYKTVDDILTKKDSSLPQVVLEKSENSELTKEQRDSAKVEKALVDNAYYSATEEVEAALAYPPNNSFLGSSSLRVPFPMGLWVYNGFVNKKSLVGKWIFDSFAATPVFLSSVNPEVRAKVAQNTLRNHGYFQGTVDYNVLTSKNPRKAKVSYTIYPRRLYRLDSIAYVRFPTVSDSLIRATTRLSLLRKGDPFSVLNLDAERNRLYQLFRNNGYYYFKPEYVSFLADTIQKPYHVQLRVVPTANLSQQVKNRYYMGKTKITIYNPDLYTVGDSVVFRDFTMFFSDKNKKPPVRFGAIRRNLYYQRGSLFQQDLHTFIQERISAMGVFSQVNMKYVPRDTTETCDTLDVEIMAVLDKPYDGEFETKVTSKSNGQIGPGVSFGMSKRNAFRGAETVKFEVHGAYEWQTNSTVQGKSAVINSYEYGTSLSLDYPRLVIPSGRKLSRRARTSTSFVLNASWLNRAGYFNMVSLGARVAYTYQGSRTVKHEFIPFRLDYDELLHTTSDFDSIMDANQALYVSMRNQFVPSMRYIFTYSSTPHARNPRSFTFEVKESGNVTSGIFAAFGQSFNQKDKKLFSVPFAQFLRFTAEYRESFKVAARSYIATRVTAGVIYSYGNSVSAPYNDLFSVGGANSIRAFTVRGVGPGRYHPGKSAYSYIDQMGDLKFEVNAEYRFPIISSLYGAVFLDAGNVWLLKNDKGRPDGEFNLSGIGKDLALGTGVGLRYDLDFLVLRFDVGVGIHAPYDTGKSGYYNMPKFKDSLGYHLAVGYPF